MSWGDWGQTKEKPKKVAPKPKQYAAVAKPKPVVKVKPNASILLPKGAPKYFENQLATANHLLEWPRTYDASDPGTGKTRSELAAWSARYEKDGKKLLVLCPKSVMETAWGDDLDKFFPGMYRSVMAYANNREKAFASDADVYVTNLDAAKWLAKQNKKFFDKFDELVIDEATAFKNQNSQRSRAVGQIAENFTYVREMSGTPMPKSVLDIWYQIYLLDRGQRLGNSFFRFRNQMCDAVQVGPRPEHRQWVDKENASTIVAGLIEDITIRHRFEDCHDIPPNVQRKIHFNMSKAHAAVYKKMKDEALLELGDDVVMAVNAAVLANKLVQLASGSVYSSAGKKLSLFSERIELVIELVKERQHSVVFFQWEHQRDALIEAAKREGIEYEVIDGTTNDRRRTEIIRSFQEGRYQTLFLQPQSTAHGITLTRATASIWTSPTYRPDIMRQGLARVYRAGQDKLTENIMICARGTVDEHVYDVMAGKETRMSALLEFLEG